MRSCPDPVLLMAILIVTGCASAGGVSQPGQPCSRDLAAEERAVRSMSASYATVRDVETEVAEFTEDVWFFSTLTPQPTVGRAARRQTIERRRAPAPSEHTRRETTGVHVSACGDVAVEHGRYVTVWDGPAGPDSVAGYYLQMYRKDGDQWKIAAASVHRRMGTAPSPSDAQSAAVAVGPDTTRSREGRFIAPAAGTALKFCNSPGLSVNLTLDSVAVRSTTFAMGTATIAVGGSNAGAHPADDEAVYFLRGEGRAFVGSDTAEVRPGLTMYVPRGVPHGFISTGSTPLEFLWTVAPGRLATGFRSRGIAPGTACQPPQR